MTSFAAASVALTNTVFATFGTEGGGTLRPDSGGPATGVRVILRRPTEEQRVEGMSVVKTKPILRIPVADAPTLRKGDLVDVEDRCWRLASAPRKPGDARGWLVEIEDVGPAGWPAP